MILSTGPAVCAGMEVTSVHGRGFVQPLVQGPAAVHLDNCSGHVASGRTDQELSRLHDLLDVREPPQRNRVENSLLDGVVGPDLLRTTAGEESAGRDRVDPDAPA